MAENFDIVLEHLKALRAENFEIRETLRRIERNTTTDHLTVAHQRADFDNLRERLERIERRLDLREENPPH